MIGSWKAWGIPALAFVALAGCEERGASSAAASSASAPAAAAPPASASPVQTAAAAQPAAIEARGLDDDTRLQLRALAQGPMARLIVHPETRPFWGEKVFTDSEGKDMTLADFRGQVTLLNFWATWCAPCRKEMPDLDALQRDLGGADFQVAPMSRDRGGAVEKGFAFYQEIGVRNLPLFVDPKTPGLAQDFAVMGLPVSVLLDREGREVARLTGDADWHSPEAQAVIRHLIASTAP